MTRTITITITEYETGKITRKVTYNPPLTWGERVVSKLERLAKRMINAIDNTEWSM